MTYACKHVSAAAIAQLGRDRQFVFASRCILRVVEQIDVTNSVCVDVVRSLRTVLAGESDVGAIPWERLKARLWDEAVSAQDLGREEDVLEACAAVVGMMTDLASSTDSAIGASALCAAVAEDLAGDDALARECARQRDELAILQHAARELSIKECNDAVSARVRLR